MDPLKMPSGLEVCLVHLREMDIGQIQRLSNDVIRSVLAICRWKAHLSGLKPSNVWSERMVF